MSWNYRVLRIDHAEGFSSYEIREIYYDDETGKIVGWSKDEMAPIGEDVDELKRDIKLMLEALKKPILSKDELHHGED